MFDFIAMGKHITETGIKRKYVAENARLSESTLSQILSGKRKCGVEEYVRLCQAIDVPFERFIVLSTKDSKPA